jgi:hypothetical protein
MVRDGSGVATKLPTMSEGPDGSTYISWFETIDGGHQVRMQRLDVDGNAMWPYEGVVVCSNAKVISTILNGTIRSMDIVTDRQGNVIVGCVIQDSNTVQTALFKLDPSGTFLWDPIGVTVFGNSPVETQVWVDIAVVNDSSLVFTKGALGYIEVMHIDHNGALRWPVPITYEPTSTQTGPFTSSTSNQFPHLAAVSENSFAITFYRLFSGGSSQPNPATVQVRSAIFTLEGTSQVALWGPLGSQSDWQRSQPSAMSDGAGGCYVLGHSQGRHWLFRLAADQTTWAVELRGDQYSPASMTLTTNGEGVMVTHSKNSVFHEEINEEGNQLLPPAHYELRVQLVDSTGSKQFGELGALLVENERCEPFGISALDDGAIISYLKDNDPFIHVMRVGMDGGTVWPDTSRLVSSNPSDKSVCSLGDLREGHCLVLWQDDRNAAGIYAQNIPINGPGIVTATQDLAGSSGSFELTALYGDQGGLLEIRSSMNGTAQLRVFDTAGHLMQASSLALSEGTQRVSPGLSYSGMVIIEVTLQGVRKQIRMVQY